MKLLRIFLSVLVLGIVSAGPVAADETATWAETLQQGIASLDLSDEQKDAIAGAFDGADSAYGDAFAAARQRLGSILTDEQKTGLTDMADAEIQKRLAGDAGERTQSIADIASDLGVTETQKSAMGKVLSGLGGVLDGIDAELISSIKSVLNQEQLAKIATWL
jgi:hypothetical protein